MSDNLPAVYGGLFAAKRDRQVSKALTRLDASSTVARRRDLVRLERITETTQHGMLAVSHLASVEAALCQVTPHAAERIRAVAVAGAIGIVGVVHDAGRGF
jgi:hypothetical protein